jgi:hypothetical protein
VLDGPAEAAYRGRIARPDKRLDVADRAGGIESAVVVHAERAALMAEARHAVGLRGRACSLGAGAEPAGGSVTVSGGGAVRRLEPRAPLTACLRSCLRSGRLVRYRPAAGGPGRWKV